MIHQNPIQLGQVDNGKFNFPASSLPKGEDVRKLNFSLFLPDFDLILEDAWSAMLYEHQRYSWRRAKYMDQFIEKFKNAVEKRLLERGIDYWLSHLYARFCCFVRNKKVIELRWRDIFNYVSFYDQRQLFTEDILPRIWEKGLEFQKSLTLAKIDNIDDLVSKKFIESFPAVAKPVESKDLIPSFPDVDPIRETVSYLPTFPVIVETVEPKDLIPVAEPLQIPSMIDEHSECAIVREGTNFPTLFVKLEEKVEKNVFYQSQVELLYPFYEFDIRKPMFLFSYLEDLLYDLYEFNITNFLSFGEKGVM